jgi:hypothetical protein
MIAATVYDSPDVELDELIPRMVMPMRRRRRVVYDVGGYTTSYSDLSAQIDVGVLRAEEDKKKRNAQADADYKKFSTAIASCFGPYAPLVKGFLDVGWGIFTGIGSLINPGDTKEKIEKAKQRATESISKLLSFGMMPPVFDIDLWSPTSYADMLDKMLAGVNALPDSQRDLLRDQFNLIQKFKDDKQVTAMLSSGFRIGQTFGPGANPRGGILLATLYALDRHFDVEKAKKIGYDIAMATGPDVINNAGELAHAWAITAQAISDAIPKGKPVIMVPGFPGLPPKPVSSSAPTGFGLKLMSSGPPGGGPVPSPPTSAPKSSSSSSSGTIVLVLGGAAVLFFMSKGKGLFR